MHRIVVVALLFVGAVASIGGRPSAAQAATCFGEPATIVSSGSGRITGTGGRDVIVSRGNVVAETIYGLGGDDLICTDFGDTVYAGAGNDSVDALDANAVYLESGHDYALVQSSNGVFGGSGNDTIEGYTVYAAASGGAGNDTFLGASMKSCDGGSGADSKTATACDASTNIP